MNTKPNQRKKQALNVIESAEFKKKADEILSNLRAQTWRDLETKGKFTKNQKLSFIRDDMLIIGCDIGSDTHYMRAIDTRGRELSRKAFAFDNNIGGFQAALDWAVALAAANDKEQIVLGLEPTGHYWFCLATWMVQKGVTVVQVNPYAVKSSKEIEDNSQRKDDCKDPKIIANLVKDGNYGMPYQPDGVYAELRNLSNFRDKLVEDRGRYMNRIHREMRIYYPEYTEALGKMDGAFSLELIKNAPFPEEIRSLGIDGIKDIWKNAKLKGRGYSRASGIVTYAENSVGKVEGIEVARLTVKSFARKVLEVSDEIEEVEELMRQKCRELPHAENIIQIPGIGETTMAGILAELGDISRFDDVKEIQKLSGMSLVACSSGKHKGETKISRRGRKRLRYWLFQAAKTAVVYSPEFKALHKYYTTRADNSLKKMQSLVVIGCKILRVVYTMLKTGAAYDPEKMIRDIHLPEALEMSVA